MAIQGSKGRMAPVQVIGGDAGGPLAAIGLSTRAPQEGPERELVTSFLSRGIRQRHRGAYVTAFVEPRLETGFPDIVIAHWRPRAFAGWNNSRPPLGATDVRILHFLHGVRGADMETLCRMLDPRQARLADSLERLQLAQLVRLRGDVWVPRALSRTFGIRDLIAVEAKVRDWRRALEQASLNKWFASRSYVLMPISSVGDSVLRHAKDLGVGVIARCDDEEMKELLESPVDGVPRSYGSWLFNEWVGRSITHGHVWGEHDEQPPDI